MNTPLVHVKGEGSSKKPTYKECLVKGVDPLDSEYIDSKLEEKSEKIYPQWKKEIKEEIMIEVKNKMQEQFVNMKKKYDEKFDIDQFSNDDDKMDIEGNNSTHRLFCYVHKNCVVTKNLHVSTASSLGLLERIGTPPISCPSYIYCSAACIAQPQLQSWTEGTSKMADNKNLLQQLPAMALLIILLLHPPPAAEAQPSPGYYPSSMVTPMAFSEGYDNLWGPQHQTVSQDKKALTLLMDRSSGNLQPLLAQLSISDQQHRQMIQY